jgi:transposase
LAKTDRVDARLLAQLGVLHRRAIALLAGLAARRSPRFKPLHDRLRDTGREPKAAIIAITRKRLVTFNAMVRDDAEFEPTTA